MRDALGNGKDARDELIQIVKPNAQTNMSSGADAESARRPRYARKTQKSFSTQTPTSLK